MGIGRKCHYTCSMKHFQYLCRFFCTRRRAMPAKTFRIILDCESIQWKLIGFVCVAVGVILFCSVAASAAAIVAVDTIIVLLFLGLIPVFSRTAYGHTTPQLAHFRTMRMALRLAVQFGCKGNANSFYLYMRALYHRIMRCFQFVLAIALFHHFGVSHTVAD